MDNIQPKFRAILLCLFASSLREAEHSRSHVKSLAESTIREALNQVGATFKSNFWLDPTRGPDTKYWPVLNLQLKGYQRSDPKPDKQRCLNPVFIRQYMN